MKMLALFALFGAVIAAPTAMHKPWMNKNDPPEARAQAILAQMTLEEKLAMLHGPPSGPCCQCKNAATCAYVGNVAENKRLGIPPINMNDGPQGFRDNNSPGSTTGDTYPPLLPPVPDVSLKLSRVAV